MKTILICITPIITNIIFSYLHIIYTADKVAKLVGHIVSVGILPFFVGGVLGCVTIIFLNKNFWWLPVICAFVTLIPLIHFIWLMSSPNH